MAGIITMDAVAERVRAVAWAGDRTAPAGFESHCGKLRFGTLAIPFTPLCQCLSEETLKAVGPFYQSALECVTVVDSTTHSNPPRSAIVALAYCRIRWTKGQLQVSADAR